MAKRFGLATRKGWVAICSAVFVLVVAVASTSALGASEETDRLPSQSEIAATIESGETEGLPKLTDPSAAEHTSLENLQRDEALELLTGVFETPVNEAAGIYDELQEAELLSPHVAVLPEGKESEQGPSKVEPEANSDAGDQSGRDEAAEALPEAEARKVEGGPRRNRPSWPTHHFLIRRFHLKSNRKKSLI
jgi:hypothetical protein